jgi:hypothetical protein
VKVDPEWKVWLDKEADFRTELAMALWNDSDQRMDMDPGSMKEYFRIPLRSEGCDTSAAIHER